MAIDDLWYKNAIIYCLDVEKYQDANGDGIGDFEGLMRRLDYLQGLGVTCVWLQPFYPSPNRDNGYDVADFYGVNDKHGSLGDFVAFMQHADGLGIRVLVDLVVNHTSIDSPWFQQARADPKSFFRDWYVWSDIRPKNHKEGIVFPGQQTTTWTKDRRAGKYYFHRFYDHQPDLNTWHPYVRAEIQKIMGFWLQLGVSGFRMDAVPFLIEKKGAGIEHQVDFNLLKEMRDFLQWRSGEAIMLAEANVPPDESLEYFGDEGDRLQMMLNFPVNQRLFYALATGDHRSADQGARGHAPPAAERAVGAVSPQPRRARSRPPDARAAAEGVRRVRAREADAALRSRDQAAAGADARQRSPAARARVQPAVLAARHADDAVRRRDRHRRRPAAAGAGVRANADAVDGRPARRLLARAPKSCGRSSATRCTATRSVNVADQRRDPQSLLNWTERMIRARKECPEISWGNFVVLRTNIPEVLAMRYDWRNTSLVTLHNFSSAKQKVKVKVGLAARRAARRGVRRPSQQGLERRHAPHRDGRVRLAVVSRRRRGQRPRSIRPGPHESDAVVPNSLESG